MHDAGPFAQGLLSIPSLTCAGARPIDLYDRVGLIPFDKLTTFFRNNLK